MAPVKQIGVKILQSEVKAQLDRLEQLGPLNGVDLGLG